MCSADFNECELEIHSCSPYANCTDTDGSFNCTCREGFEGDGFNCSGMYNKQALLCAKMITYLNADILECERELDDCDPNANCTNTIGGYICTCNIGFTGDGYMCPG